MLSLIFAAQVMTVVASAPPVSPEDAAKIFAASSTREHQVALPAAPRGPRITIVGSTPGALGWLAFPAERPARRLDGTLLAQPATVYGGPVRGRRVQGCAECTGVQRR